LLIGIAAGTLGVMGLASLYRAATLARGGGQVARMLGATEVTGEGSDLLRRRLLNVVEEMAIASGVPVPEVFVLEQESAINAFAAGLSTNDAAIAVTRGALERLDRAELQGVIAHEFSHVLNGDMRLNQQLIGMSFGILVLSLAGRWLVRSARFGRRGRNSGGVAAALMFGVALTIIGAIGVFFSRLIKAAVSRQREMLADASAVQFTREPEGLAGALKKIGGHTARFSSVDTEEVAHMLFEHQGSRAFSGLFATHPPLLDRIRALDPTFEAADLRKSGAPLAAAPAAAAQTIHSLAPASDAAPETLLQRAGQIESAALGSALREAVPEELYHAAHARELSFLLVLAMALGARDEVRQRQLALLENQLGSERANRCRSLHRELQSLDPKLQLPLLELTLPALKQRPNEQVEYLFELIGRITALDAEQRLFDYVLLRVLAAYLRDLPGAPRGGWVSYAKQPRPKLSTRDALAALLASIAAFGHDSAADARVAYRAGFARISAQSPAPEPTFDPPSAVRDLATLDAALERLASLRPRAKRRVLTAVLATIQQDRKIEVAEQELFRAVAATLGCPLPPTALQSTGGSAAQIR
ncbi:MAG TPA: M48 family metallopeptidase, partial [Gammaproteobacteria bacterium]|nr:M48 family metallopeptidase [Gammaproteobacteria bacterium]